uniref:Uncharacterized protein n=1 Tax=Desertifilum tharense IPPAS B-1220 TaxID=1781255 RepID=A0ACD5H2Z3_9CYAN
MLQSHFPLSTQHSALNYGALKTLAMGYPSTPDRNSYRLPAIGGGRSDSHLANQLDLGNFYDRLSRVALVIGAVDKTRL